MKNILFVLAFLWLNSLQALETSISYATFSSPNSPYVEVYLHILGASVTFKPVNSDQTQAAVEVVIVFKQNGEIVKFDKYSLKSPLSKSPKDFIDLKRYALPDGDYDMEVSVKDQRKPANAKTYNANFKIEYGSKLLLQSDLQLLASFKKDDSKSPMVKNGYYLETLPFNFYHKKLSRLIVYNEIYNATEAMELPFLVRYYIEKVNGKGETKTMMMGHKTQKPRPINVVLLQMDISKLENGNYNLVVEVRNPDEILLSKKKVFFQRSNPYLELEKIQAAPIEEEFVTKLSDEDVSYSLRAIAMNAPDGDVEVINLLLSNEDPEPQRRYLFSYWALRAPNSPEAVYNKYMEVARAVDKTYASGFGFGFETDRGWTFMKYGKPDDMISIDNEVSAPPYEIWTYNKVARTNQPNGKFLFFNPSLAAGNYQLLHSTVRGEISNPNWEQELYREANETGEPNSNDFDATSMNRNAREYFTDF